MYWDCSLLGSVFYFGFIVGWGRNALPYAILLFPFREQEFDRRPDTGGSGVPISADSVVYN
jgi:hypothetical protein